MDTPHRWFRALKRAASFLVVATLIGAALERTLYAFNYVIDANGTYWGIQDDASPRVDTGSVWGTQEAPGRRDSPFSTALQGFGGIRALVETTPAPHLNGEVMRGFGLVFDGVNRFTTTQSVNLGGVLISRALWVNTSANWARWLDTFTNATNQPLTVRVAFGGQSGTGTGTSNNLTSEIASTSSGDALITSADAWAMYASPLQNGFFAGPQAAVIGTPAPFTGAMTFAGNWLYNDAFNSPLLYTGHERNFQAYVNTLTIAPGTSQSVLHFLVAGRRVATADAAAAERASVEATAAQLAMTPDVSDLSEAEICSIANFDIAAMSIPGFDHEASCAVASVVPQPPAPEPPNRHTSARYDVFEKTIQELRADLEAGITTSREITKAYLDRIAAYDVGPFGFHAFHVIAEDAMAQANRADVARKKGENGPLLGIPIAVKNNYDTKDMVTTNGSFTFENFRPAKDAFQVAKLREAGAVIIGKTAMSEYASSGHFGNDAWGQVWNVFNPSKASLASSSGSGSAVAASMAAAAMGSQTGNSLYGPSGVASLVTLRGTDGLESGTGIMPLTWMTDFGGAMTRSVADLADMLNVLVGEDPLDPATSRIDHTKIPEDWRSVLNLDALQGKRIGYVDAAWADVYGPSSPPFGTNNTIDAMKAAAFTYLTAAGATIVQMGRLAPRAPFDPCPSVPAGDPCPDAPPSPPAPSFPGGSIRAEGWRQYIDSHPELLTQGFSIFTEADVDCSQRMVLYSRRDPGDCTPQRRLTPDEIQQHRDYRQITRPAGVQQWMDDANVDAVVYPSQLSDLSVNDGGAPGGSPAHVSHGRRDTPSAQNGVPTMAFPAGYNPQGQPINIQLMGRAWDDAKLLGFAFAFEHYANLDGNGHQVQQTAPPLRHGNKPN
jgi:amidase